MRRSVVGAGEHVSTDQPKDNTMHRGGEGGHPESLSEIEFVQRRINEMRFISDS
jgi:hypothetical protein